MDEAKNDTVPLLSNGGPDVAISMDGVGGDKQRYHQQLQLIDEQVLLIIQAIIIIFYYYKYNILLILITFLILVFNPQDLYFLGVLT